MKTGALLRFYIDNRKYLPGIVLIVGLSLCSGMLKMLSAAYWGRSLDYGVAGLTQEMLTAAGMMAFFILLDCARTALHYRIIGRITEDMFLGVRGRAFQKLCRASLPDLEQGFRTGDVAARLGGDIDFLSNFSAGHISNFSRVLFSGVFSLTACIFISWQLSMAYLILLPVSLWVVGAISRPIQEQGKRSMDHTGAAMSTAAGAVSGALTVKAFAAEEALCQRFNKAADEAYSQKVRSEKLGMKMTAVKYIATVAQTMSLFLLGSWLVSSGRLTVGGFVSFVALSGYITDCLSQSDYMFKSIRNASASAQRYYEVLDIPDEPAGPVCQPIGESPAPCAAQNLGFAYSLGGRPVLDGLTLSIPAGKKVAVVGASGCGKSTLIKLICRLHLPLSGSLTLFGAQAEEWAPEKLRAHISLVTQDPCLFGGSFYDNVALGRPGATRAQCEAALRSVRLWDFVCTFPEGMDHPIGEGGQNLSGGQKQRLCIARAMVKQAPLVLLDEPTSALDMQTEREVQQALDRLLEGRSAVIIAHRLSTVQRADYIYVLEKGRVAEEGSPQALLSQRGRYYEMCRLQGLEVEP